MSTYEYIPGCETDAVIIPQYQISMALEQDKPMGGRGRAAASTLLPGAAPSAVVPYLALYPTSGGDIMPWGTDNDFPQRITALYAKDPIIPATLGKIMAMVQGKGVIPVLEDVDDDGDPIRFPLPKNNPVTAEIWAYLNSRYHKQYMREMASDATMYFNGFPEMLLSKNREKIVQLHPLNAEEARWCRMDKDGNMPYIYLNANWPYGSSAAPDTKKIKALDPYRSDSVEWLREQREFNVVYPIRFPTPGQRFYSLPHHYSLVESGWLDVHLAVPQFKKYLLKNQMSIKYHIKVHEKYWPLALGDAYDKADPLKKKAMIKAWVDNVTSMLTNVENAAAMLMTQVKSMISDESKIIDLVTITPIQDPIKDGKYIEDNLEAAANIFYALNTDPTLVGFAGGEKMGARSGGSDKLQAYLIALQMLSPFRDMLVEPLDFMADYNGWRTAFPLLKFIYPDQNPSAKKGDQPKQDPKKTPTSPKSA